MFPKKSLLLKDPNIFKTALFFVIKQLAWEEEHGRIPDGAVVVLNSGWGERFSSDTPSYFGIDREAYAEDPADYSEMHHPGISGEAARWLVENRYHHRTRVNNQFPHFKCISL